MNLLQTNQYKTSIKVIKEHDYSHCFYIAAKETSHGGANIDVPRWHGAPCIVDRVIYRGLRLYTGYNH